MGLVMGLVMEHNKEHRIAEKRMDKTETLQDKVILCAFVSFHSHPNPIFPYVLIPFLYSQPCEIAIYPAAVTISDSGISTML